MGIDPLSLLIEGGLAIWGGLGSAATAVGSAIGIGGAAETAGVIGLDAATAGDLFGMTAAEVAGTAGTAASSLPGWLSLAGAATNIAGGVTGAIGAEQSAKAQAAAANYNAQIAAQNATQATRNAGLASQAGEAQAGIQGQKNRAMMGALVANEAASGVDVNSGSKLDVRTSGNELSQMDVLTIRSNAAKEAYGYQTQAKGYEAESKLGKSQAGYDIAAGDIQAGSTILGSVGSSATNFARYLQAGGLDMTGLTNGL